MPTRRIHIDLDEHSIQRLDSLKKTVNFSKRSDVLNLILPKALNALEQSIREALTESIKHPVPLGLPDNTEVSDPKEI